jgi:hypothetical protein
MAGALDTRALCCLAFTVAVAIAIVINVPTLLLAIVVRVALDVT